MLKGAELLFRRVLLRTLRVAGRGKTASGRTDFRQCKYLFVRQDRIGDVLVSTPLIAALKEHYPDAVIDVLLSSNNHFVLDSDTSVRKRWIYDKKLLSSLKTIRGIRAERYDFVIDLMDNPSATSTVILLLARGVWNVGLAKENEYAYDIVVPMLSRQTTHIVDRLARLLDVFGIESSKETLRIRYQTRPESDQGIKSQLSRKCAQGARIVGVNISAGSDARFWGVASYQNLLERIRSHDPGLCLILLFKSQDGGRAKEIAQSVPGVVLVPTKTFDEFAAAIKTLWVLISPDTSAVHLAAAFRIPSVILYVQSDPSLRIWEPYKTECEPVITTERTLAALPVESVVDAFLKLTDKVSQESTRRSEHA